MYELIRHTTRIGPLLVCLLAAAACGVQPSQPTGSAVTAAPPPVAGATETSTPNPVALEPPLPDLTPSRTAQDTTPQETTFRGARSISVTSAGDGTVYAVIGVDDALQVARVQAHGRSFGEAVRATGDIPAIVLPVERPSIAVDENGRVAVSWLEPNHEGQVRVWYSQSTDGGRTFAAPREAGSSSGHEGAMVRMTFDRQRNALIAWLRDGSLEFGRSLDGGTSFAPTHTVDAEVCDCCQPDPLVAGGSVFVAYRNVVSRGADDLRDIYVTASYDRGATFGEAVKVSDASWQINACPISGPALAADAERLYVAFMDGRNDDGSGTRGELWLASSADGGLTWGKDVRVNEREQGLHTLPALASGPGGRLHLAWEIHAEERTAIAYTTSVDGGATFAPPQLLARSDDGAKRGPPTAPSLAVTPTGQIYLAWVDRLGAHVLAWSEAR